MGSSHCCSLQSDDKSEIVLKIEDTEKSSLRSSRKSPKKQQETPSQKEKLLVHPNKCEDPATPGFADLQSFGSKHSEQSCKDIQLVAEIVMNLEDIPKKIEEVQQSPITSQRSLKKRRKNDSPLCDFQPKNSLKSFDSKKLNKLKSLSEHRVKFEEKSDNESNRSNSADNKSVKSIMKQELKYSQFRKMQTLGDAESRKKVHFQLNK
ncbi:unnamed protein product (macronuclear) [Paramecium tetraurelia]|uniref:Uncharacterized protein n=1 Tax=Paramecium tetraurelia TaxID=5888 RepID=A0D3K6_PARTE|nr:uncharacterized protein GSPATT00013111001 [Paramecium tetraurelia]CAK77623.1 unnamed protein product [Paramecium tetraurelia]|eukprot:XP_001445020.1 hypothetical protein (macronuclear) [Paramecium tetraurelia strain d4-2]